jgi:hypothetical protein
MSAGHPLIAFDVAISHQDDLLQQAEDKRLVAVAGTTGHSFAGGFSDWMGHLLVRVGEHLQTTQRRPIAGDLDAAAGALRIAR